MFSIIKNAQEVRHKEVNIPYSNFKFGLAKILENEGYIASCKPMEKERAKKTIRIVLKYDKEEKPVISDFKMVSLPSARNYSTRKKLPRVQSGLGITIVSTSRGLMSDREARKKNLGGEVICQVW